MQFGAKPGLMDRPLNNKKNKKGPKTSLIMIDDNEIPLFFSFNLGNDSAESTHASELSVE